MAGSVEPDEQLEWERRAGRPAGIAAFASALLLLAGQLIYPVVFIADQPNSQAESLKLMTDDPAHAYVPGIMQALTYLTLIVPLYYLYRATKARRAQLLSAARWFALLGPPIAGVAFLVRQALLVGAAADLQAEKLPTGAGALAGGAAELAAMLFLANDRAAELIGDVNQTPVLGIAQFAGVLLVAFAFVLISLNAMRAGLLSRFMGYLGVVVGVINVLAVLGVTGSFVQIFWLLALGPLLLNRWPGGRGPAWGVVEEVPWPSGTPREDETEAGEEPGPELDDGPDDGPPPAQHPSSKKRRKKKRR